MNITKHLSSGRPMPFWLRQKRWREFLKWTFAFCAVITVLSGVLYLSS